MGCEIATAILQKTYHSCILRRVVHIIVISRMEFFMRILEILHTHSRILFKEKSVLKNNCFSTSI